MRSLLDDVRNGWRRLVRQPGAAAGAVALLALAIGVTSAMFAVVDAFIVRPAPFRDPSTLTLLTVGAGNGSPNLDFAKARVWRDSGIFDAVRGVIINAVGDVEGLHGTTTRSGAWVTPDTFAMLGVTPLLGREFVSGEGREGTDKYVLLSEPVWREQFDGDGAIVGKTIQVTGVGHVVVGVMPADTRFPFRGDGIWHPVDLDQPAATVAKRRVFVYVRTKAGVPAVDTARLALAAIGGPTKPGERVVLQPASGMLLDAYSRDAIVALAVGVGLVFVVLCANVTALVLSRTSARRQEFGVCAALGASRWQLLRQVFLENAAIGACASVLGLGLAYGLVALAQRFLPEEILWRTLNPLDVDLRAVMATSAAGILATLVAGLPPAWLGTKTNTADSLRLGSRGGTDTRGSRRLTRGLLVVEVAMAVALLAAAGLQARSFVNLVEADRGIDSERVLVATVSLPASHFADRPSRAAFATVLQDRLRALPGVESTAIGSGIPPTGGDLHFYDVQPDIPGGPSVKLAFNGYHVAPDFFQTYGVQLIQGRGFNAGDADTDVVISAVLGRSLFGETSPLGHSFSFGKQTYRVIGVAAEVRTPSLDPREDHPEFYQPLYVRPAAGAAPGLPGSSRPTVGIRCGDPCASIESIREGIRQASPNAKLESLRPLADSFLEQLSRPRVAAVIAMSFAGLALFATAAGLYGVLGYVVSRRKREYGIRAAMGAAPGALGRSVFVDGARVTAVGVVVGAGAGWALSRWLGSVQFGVTFFDVTTWAAVIATALTMSVAASWRPARQAMRVDPATLLREE